MEVLLPLFSTRRSVNAGGEYATSALLPEKKNAVHPTWTGEKPKELSARV